MQGYAYPKEKNNYSNVAKPFLFAPSILQAIAADHGQKSLIVFIGGFRDEATQTVRKLTEQAKIEFADSIENNRLVIKYFPWNEADQITSFITDHVKGNRESSIVLVGYSYGGDTAYSLAQRLGTRIRLLVTLDPVGNSGINYKIDCSPAYPESTSRKSIEQINCEEGRKQRTKPVNVSEWLNIWVSGGNARSDLVAQIGGAWNNQKFADANYFLSNVSHSQAYNMYSTVKDRILSITQSSPLGTKPSAHVITAGKKPQNPTGLYVSMSLRQRDYEFANKYKIFPAIHYAKRLFRKDISTMQELPDGIFLLKINNSPYRDYFSVSKIGDNVIGSYEGWCFRGRLEGNKIINAHAHSMAFTSVNKDGAVSSAGWKNSRDDDKSLFPGIELKKPFRLTRYATLTPSQDELLREGRLFVAFRFSPFLNLMQNCVAYYEWYDK
jgi:pimeloyl-ACP methyl ester carboxylesterase